MTESRGENKALELFDMKQDLVNATYKLKIVDKNVNTIAVNLKKTEIVQKEIGNLEENTRMFDRCGRIFVLTKKDDIMDKLKNTYNRLASDLEGQREVKKKIEETVSEQTKQYNELARNLR